MAHFEKRGTKWRAQISWYDIHGNRKFKTKQGFLTKSAARKWANEMEVAKDANQISNQDPIFAEYFKDWYQTYKAPGTSNNTKNRYDTIYRLLTKYFGKTKLSKVTRHQYQEFMNDYGKNHVKSTVYKTNGSIRTSIKDALADGLVRTNFTERINLSWNDERSRKVEYLNFNQVQQLKNSLLDGIKPSFVSRYMLLTIIYTGMRPGEIRVLTWHDIDYQNHTINISKSWDYDNDKIVNYDSDEINKDPKNHSSTRVIKVDDHLLDILNQLKINHHERLFVATDGTIPTSTAVNKVLRKQLKKLNLDKANFHFHSLRHTHVAMLLFKGVDLYSISKRLGHSNMSITANTYAYMLDELKQQSDQQIVDILDEI
ncbi:MULTISPECIES: site-specific integrase [Lactobacillus]|uniref:Site-specific integrase n=1 Tax=Lactobacillus xujianguonis TaxID=2495899 RepID=A0A437SWK2_9LACO|nr:MULTISPECIES: site-specific integrase [Lactobacillus]RVU71197.1 site-specific integrase [Lactobacillus xujianguonis]RVU74122.1 site-specific integrase [Lactobacillus xujianguonis]